MTSGAVLGSAYEDTSSFEEAIEAFRKAIAPYADQALAYNDLADVHLRLGQLDEEVARLHKRRLELGPEGAFNAHVSLGVVACHHGDLATSLEKLETAPALWDTAWKRGLQSKAALLETKALALLGLEREEEALATLKQAIAQGWPDGILDFSGYDLLTSAPEPPPALHEMRLLLEEAIR